MKNSTIAAISTPYGKGGIAMIRVSGAEAVSVCDKMFVRKNGVLLKDTESNHAVYGDIYHENEIIDDGMVIIYRSPHSYTGEDVAEITCHGGILLAKLVLESVLLSGAEPAEAGEFTRRAFLNGKLGLISAESVIDSIEAGSKEKLKLATQNSKNILSGKIAAFYEELKVLISNIYVYIDFPDEDLTDIPIEELLERLKILAADMKKLLETYHTGKAVNEGISTVIAGKPNTGKSSLLNALVGENRAIVTDIAGTTRDTIEETVTAGKVLLRLTDTAGVRSTDDKIEKLGVERTLEKIRSADLIIAVFDMSEDLDEEDHSLTETIISAECEIIAVMNKADLPFKSEADADFIKKTFPNNVTVSTITGKGLNELISGINEMFAAGDINYNETAVISSARQYTTLKGACEAILNGIKSLETGFTQDVAGLDLEHAMTLLGEVDGHIVTDEIVHEIFTRFCVGK